MLKDRGEKFKAEDSTEIASKIKEKYGYVCKDVLKEYKKYDEKVVDANGNIS
jgi:actin-related protein 3